MEALTADNESHVEKGALQALTAEVKVSGCTLHLTFTRAVQYARPVELIEWALSWRRRALPGEGGTRPGPGGDAAGAEGGFAVDTRQAQGPQVTG